LAKQKLVLARAIGLPLGQQFEITTHIPYQELTPASLDEAIQSAFKARPDFQSQLNRVDHAYEQRDAGLPEIKSNPLFKNLHHDPRYSELLRKMRLPA
jgi:outer membrane protein TolC